MNLPETHAVPLELLNQASCGMALLDANQTVIWCNSYLDTILGLPGLGLSPSTCNALPAGIAILLFSKQQTIIWQTATGDRWLNRETCHMQSQSLLIVKDITQQQQQHAEILQLRRQIEDLRLNDDLTGLPNKRAITQALEQQISRSRRYQNPLSVIMVRIEIAPEPFLGTAQTLDDLVLSASRFLRNRLRWVDQIGRWEDNLFLLVLPETEQADAQALLDKIRQDQSSIHLPAPYQDLQLTLSFGTGCWRKGDDIRSLLKQVSQNLAAD